MSLFHALSKMAELLLSTSENTMLNALEDATCPFESRVAGGTILDGKLTSDIVQGGPGRSTSWRPGRWQHHLGRNRDAGRRRSTGSITALAPRAQIIELELVSAPVRYLSFFMVQLRSLCISIIATSSKMDGDAEPATAPTRSQYRNMAREASLRVETYSRSL